MGNESRRKLIAVTINLIIGLLHILGPLRQESGTWHDLYYSYFSDLTLPFGFYFLLGMAESNIQFLKPWWVKAGFLFLATLTAELLQRAGVYALGTVFDPVDIVMYASGISLAVLIERFLFPGLFLSREK